MFIELHFIQSFAPSVLNRDDTNNHKDTYFGGTRRLRVSSQCFKRSMRFNPEFVNVFNETSLEDPTKLYEAQKKYIGLRSKRLALEWLKPELVKHVSEDKADLAEKIALAFVESLMVDSGGMDKDETQTSVLLYLHQDEVKWIADELIKLKDQWEIILLKPTTEKPAEEKPATRRGKKPAEASSSGNKEGKLLEKIAKSLKEQLGKRTSAPDIALFGRMLAGKTETNLDAACQVANVISTHAVRKFDVDYFTAVDDLKKDAMGAGMVGMTPFASACFYRYMRLDWEQLKTNLRSNEKSDDDSLARKTVEGFLRAAEAATPSGKQNSFDNNARPSFMLAVARRGGASWSLVNAFEQAVQGNNGYVAESEKQLSAQWDRFCEIYGDKSIIASAVLLPDARLTKEKLNSPRLQQVVKSSMDELVQAMIAPEVLK